MIEIKEADLVPCKILGQDFELKKPDLGQVDRLEGLIKENPDSSVKYVIHYLVELGLTKEVAERLNTDQAEYLVKEISGKKKG